MGQTALDLAQQIGNGEFRRHRDEDVRDRSTAPPPKMPTPSLVQPALGKKEDKLFLPSGDLCENALDMAAVAAGGLIAETGHKTKVILKDGLQSSGIDKEVYIAVISMALKQYLDDVHDNESNIITIKPHSTMWNAHIEEKHF